MKTRYLRAEPTRRQSWSAAALSVAVAAGVGAVTFYVTRILLARDAIRVPSDGESKDAPASLTASSEVP